MSKIVPFPRPRESAATSDLDIPAQALALTGHLSALSSALLALSQRRYEFAAGTDQFSFDDELALLLGQAALLHEAVQRVTRWMPMNTESVLVACDQLYARSATLLARVNAGEPATT